MKRVPLLLLMASLLMAADARGSIMESLEKECTRLLQQMQPSVVSIVTIREESEILDGRGASFERYIGSGIILDEQGHVVTTGSVVEEALQIHAILFDGRRVPARVVGVDRMGNLAVLQLDASDLEPAAWGNSDGVRSGSWVVAAGSSLGPVKSVAFGMVAGRVSHLQLGPLPDYIQMNVRVRPGDSGGAVVNHEGQVVGVVAAVLDGSPDTQGQVSFAIPGNQALQIVQELIDRGHVVRGWLGATVVQTPPDESRGLADYGLLVLEVLESGPAAQGGMLLGDVLTRYHQQTIRDLTDLHQAVASTQVGSSVQVTVWRDGGPRDLTLQITEAPGSHPPDRPPALTEDERGEEGLMRLASMAFGGRVDIDYRGADHEKRRKLVHFFWSQHPEGAREEVVRRREYVQERLSVPGTPGIHTDRGKIYLQFGPPDRIVKTRPRRGLSLLDSTEGLADSWQYDSHRLAFLFGPDGDFLEGDQVRSTIHLR